MPVTELLQQLIRVPSVNPDNTPGTHHTGERQIAEFLAVWLRNLGAEVILEEILPGRPNLVARFSPVDGRPRILLGPHLDTVGVVGMTIDPFGAEIRDGRIWGRGASDTKGPMAAMLWALKQNASSLRDAPIAIDFVGFMGEESAQWGSIEFGKNHGSDYQFAIVGEPTSLDIVHSTKGSLWATLKSSGIAAHSSQPERGENAIMKLSKALQTLEDDLAPKLARFTHPDLGASTMNIGVFHGGSRPNIVPDYAEAEVDVRITPSLTEAGGALKLIEESLSGSGIDVSASPEKPPMETPADNPWIARIRNIRPESNPVAAPWFSDASHLSEAGIPSICMGPGSIDQAHTKDEFIETEDLEEGAAFFSAFVSSLTTEP